jgi:hypothetical protein
VEEMLFWSQTHRPMSLVMPCFHYILIQERQQLKGVLQQSTHFPDAFFTSWHIFFGLDVYLLLIQCIVAKLITLRASHSTIYPHILYSVKYSPHQKMFQVKVVDVNENYISRNYQCFVQ